MSSTGRTAHLPLLCLLLAVLVTASAAAAPRGPAAGPLVRSVVPTPTATAGGPLAVRVAVAAPRGRGSGKAALTLLLSADGRRDARDTRLAVVARVAALRAGARRTLALRATLPASVAPGKRRVLVCLGAKRCVASRRLVTVTAARKAAPTPGPGAAAPGAPTAPAVAPAAPAEAPATTPATTTPPPTTPTTTTPPPTPEPPAPGGDAGPPLVPTRIDPSLPTDFEDSVAFLYEGADRVQTGVAAGTIEAARVAVLRGTVRGRDGKGMPGVTVTVLDHPELGRTVSRADGGYDLAVNGGGPVTLDFARPGHLPVQRRVETPWQDFAAVEDVVLLALDPAVTPITAGAPEAQTATGTPQTDADGTRTASLVFPAGTQATMVLPDGSTRPLERLDVRATEYTVGTSGDEAMPGTLPATSAYTYAVELSVDQAIAAGATSVRFDRPVSSYTDNFLGFPVGSVVPAGYYDREAGEWKATENGRVIAITGVQDGRALVDTDGDGAPDDGLGIDTAERAQLAQERRVGDELWRVELRHFTPLDYNWPWGPPLDAEYPDPPNPRPDTPRDGRDGECNKKGSIIGCQSQSLAEELPVAGTPFKLRFDSRRTPRPTDRTLTIPLTGDRIPASLEEVRLEVLVAGRKTVHTFAPARNLAHELVWDRKDAYGREVQGRVPVYARVGFVYGPRRYATTAESIRAFGRFTSEIFEGSALNLGRPRSTTARFVAWRDFRDEFAAAVGSYDVRGTGLGGWELDAHHAYDPRSRTLYRGDGSQLDVQPALDRLASTVAAGDPRDTDLDAAGGTWVANPATDQVLRFAPDGTRTVKAGDDEDGGPCQGCRRRKAAPQAVGFTLSRPVATALAPDGGFYIADQLADFGLPNHGVIHRVDPDGSIRRYAGCDGCAQTGDGGDAREAAMLPTDLALGADGTLYVADVRTNRIRAIRPDGEIETIAGDGESYSEDGPARASAVVDPQAVEVGSNGEVYFADTADGGRVRRIEPDGSVRTVAGGNGTPDEELGDGGPATAARLRDPRGLAAGPDGALYVADATHVRRVSAAGVITTVAGGGANAVGPGAVPAGSVRLETAEGVDLAPDGTTVIASLDGVSRVSRPFPETADGVTTIPSKDGTELFRFTAQGRHVATLDALTQSPRWRFAYDAEGRLASVADAGGRVTAVQRDAQGDPQAIVAPGGQRTGLALDEGGRLRELAFPGGATASFAYDAPGRLTRMTDRRGGTHRYSYDAEGRLVRDENAMGHVQTLTRTEQETGHTVAVRSHEGRVRTFAVGVAETGEPVSTTTSTSGARTTVRVGADGVTRGTYPDGETVELTHAGDPRWGMAVPVLARVVRRTPGGRTAVTTGTRTADLADPADPLSARSVTDTFTTNGRKHTVAYDAVARTLTTRTPGGRVSRTTYDEQGRTVEHAPGAGVAPIRYVHDARGLLLRAEQGDLVRAYEYDAQERPSAVLDSAGRRTEYAYDAADNVASVRRPGGGTERYEHDAAGERTAVVVPGGRRQELAVDARGLLTGYAPAPGAEALIRTHDGDELLVAEGVAGSLVTHGREAEGGRATGLQFAGARVHYDYDGPADRPSGLRRVPEGGGTAETLAQAFDGALTTGVTQGGTATAAWSYAYDDDRFLTSTQLEAGGRTVRVELERDPDGQLTRIGPFALTRDGVDGATSRIAGAGLRLDLERDALARPSSRTLAVGGTERHRVALERDAAGRIVRRTETVAGERRVHDYGYDDDGRLTRVERDGTVTETYDYDADGNRTSRTLGDAAPEAAAYDAQGWLAARAGLVHGFDAAGRLTARGADRFAYSDRGELLSATVGSTTVSYRSDALGRRIARIVGGQSTRYLYGNPGNPVQVSASVAPDGALTSYTYDEEGLLVALERGGERYFVGTDHLGTPQVVLDAAGVVRKRIERDAFGGPVSDSAPAFALPIGFAGGLDDPVTGLVRFGFRDLDVASGRWTARDPVLFGGGQANLYEYVGSNPVGLRDPLGLWCVGGSVYEGIGGGAQVCSSEEGVSVCVEVGFGVGLDAGIGNGKAAADGESIVAEAKASVPGFGVGVGVELDNCGAVNPTGQLDTGPFSFKGDGVVEIQPPALSASAQAKLAAKVCRRLSGGK